MSPVARGIEQQLSEHYTKRAIICSTDFSVLTRNVSFLTGINYKSLLMVNLIKVSFICHFFQKIRALNSRIIDSQFLQSIFISPTLSPELLFHLPHHQSPSSHPFLSSLFPFNKPIEISGNFLY